MYFRRSEGVTLLEPWNYFHPVNNDRLCASYGACFVECFLLQACLRTSWSSWLLIHADQPSARGDKGGNRLAKGKKKQGKESVPRLLFSLDRIHGTWRADAAIYAAHARWTRPRHQRDPTVFRILHEGFAQLHGTARHWLIIHETKTDGEYASWNNFVPFSIRPRMFIRLWEI